MEEGAITYQKMNSGSAYAAVTVDMQKNRQDVSKCQQ